MIPENYPPMYPDAVRPTRLRPSVKWSIATFSALAVAVLVGGTAVVSYRAGERHEQQRADAAAALSPVYPETTETTFGDGTWKVGTDIKPGSYVAPGGAVCYWALRGPDPVNGTGSQLQLVTIKESDTAFKSVGCGLWMPRP